MFLANLNVVQQSKEMREFDMFASFLEFLLLHQAITCEKMIIVCIALKIACLDLSQNFHSLV